MAFAEKTVVAAWERSSGQCECDKRNHRHFYTPCAKPLVWNSRGSAARGGWYPHYITDSGGDGVHNCEVLCAECYKSASGFTTHLFVDPDATYLQEQKNSLAAARMDENLSVASGTEAVSPLAPPVQRMGISPQMKPVRAGDFDQQAKRAVEPFRFHNLSLLKKMTGLKATNLAEMLARLKQVPESVIYYHTHQFLQEHHYLTPEPPNDFAVWVADSLGDDVLGERLAGVNPFTFPDLGAVREKFVNIIEEHLGQHPNLREAVEGKEFYFVESKRFIFPTPYVAHDINEFAAGLRNVGNGSLYFHVFESRLKSAKGLNDFSSWLMDSLGEEQLGQTVARLDPYTYSLEGLRSTLIRLVEKRAN
jgi:hypothetical protein